MDQTNRYIYDPIKHNQLRLFKFLHDGNHTSAVLKAFSVEEPLPPYHALSYTWSSDIAGTVQSWAVQIDGNKLAVLDSLQPFAQALRRKGAMLDGTWWWIDSICIDQGNLVERTQQVRLMQQIYRLASRVIVWLGEESEDSDLAFNFIERLNEIKCEGHSTAEVRVMLQTDEHQQQWNALTNILSRKWWTRIWTIQEFVLASKAVFWCGVRTVDRTAMCDALWAADQCTSIGIKDTLAFRYGFTRRRVWDLYDAGGDIRANLNLSLLALVGYFCCMDATDDRDRLYGLMALSTDSFSLDADYSCDCQQVYLHFAQSFIRHHKSLDIICFASIYRPPPDVLWPSWVPNWQKRDEFLVTPLMVSQSSRTHIGNLRPPFALDCDTTICYSASKNKAPVFELDGLVLRTRGIVIDAVDGLAGTRNSNLVQSSETNPIKLPDCSEDRYSPSKIMLGVCRSLVLDRKERYLRDAMPTEEFFQDFMRFCILLMTEPRPPVPKELQEWFSWTKDLEIHGRSFESILQDTSQAELSASYHVPNQDESIHWSFFGRFFDTVVRFSLRLMTSRNGRIGMVSERAMKGDLVCVLFGCSVPVLLRQSDDGDTFTFVAECFLDGCMCGEILEQGGLLERSFCIR